MVRVHCIIYAGLRDRGVEDELGYGSMRGGRCEGQMTKPVSRYLRVYILWQGAKVYACVHGGCTFACVCVWISSVEDED